MQGEEPADASVTIYLIIAPSKIWQDGSSKLKVDGEFGKVGTVGSAQQKIWQGWHRWVGPTETLARWPGFTQILGKTWTCALGKGRARPTCSSSHSSRRWGLCFFQPGDFYGASRSQTSDAAARAHAGMRLGPRAYPSGLGVRNARNAPARTRERALPLVAHQCKLSRTACDRSGTRCVGRARRGDARRPCLANACEEGPSPRACKS